MHKLIAILATFVFSFAMLGAQELDPATLAKRDARRNLTVKQWNTDKGRPTKAACAAFLAKVYLYKAYRHDDAARLAVNDEREVILFLDVRASLDEQAMDLLALRARLLRDERLAEQLFRILADFILRLCDLDAASFARRATAC